MSDHCAFYTKNPAFGPNGGTVIKDWSTAAKREAPRGRITAMDGETGQILVLDLKDLTLVDRDTVRFLESCEEDGIKLKNCPAYIREWITRERGGS